MSIVIDYGKCTRDKICGEVCPRKLFVFDESKSPVLIEGADELCINCGQCLAFCPPGAISLHGVSPDDCKLVNKSIWPGSSNMDHLLQSRRSVRAYRKKGVDRQTIIELLDISRYAPTASNSQLISWKVINEPEKMKKTGQLIIDWCARSVQEETALSNVIPMQEMINAWENNRDTVLRGAPALVFNHAPEAGGMHTENCAIAMTYFELAASAKGLGTCWAGFLMLAAAFSQELRDYLAIPQGHKLYSALMLGYGKFQQLRIPERKSLTVEWL